MKDEQRNIMYGLLSNILIVTGIILIVTTVVINAADILRGNRELKQFEAQKQNIDSKPEVQGSKETGDKGSTAAGKITVNNYVTDRYDEGIAGHDQNDKDQVSGNVVMSSEKSQAGNASYVPPVVLGVMKIDKISLKEALKEGVGRSVISSALGHMEGTAYPGEEGNCVVAGHRNYVFGKYFNRLDEIEPGDCIEIETMARNYQYTVTDKFVVEPDEVSVTDELAGRQLTLITCTPLFVGSHRLIVRAELNEETVME